MMKSVLKKLKPGVSKQYLIFIASLVWFFASGILLLRGVAMLLEYVDEIWIKLLISIPLGIMFYVFMFSKIFKKHSGRIAALKHEKPCVFSFFNWKSYIMMVVMMGMGIFLRTSEIISFRYLSVFYITMGIPLLISALMFFSYGIKHFNELKNNSN